MILKIAQLYNYLKEEGHFVEMELLKIASDPLFGDCGVFAIQIVKEARKLGRELALALVHDADTDAELIYGDYKLYHVAIYHNGNYYDVRGEVKEEDLLSFMPAPPEEFYIDIFHFNEQLESQIIKNTDCMSNPEDYKIDAITFLNKHDLIS